MKTKALKKPFRIINLNIFLMKGLHIHYNIFYICVMNRSSYKNNYSFQKRDNNTFKILDVILTTPKLFYLMFYPFGVSINEKLQIVFANIRV